MNESLVYHVSLAVCGGVMAVTSLSTLLSGDVAFVPVLLSVSGVGVVATSLYAAFLSPEGWETTPSDRLVWFTAAMAALVVVASVWTVFA